MKRHITASAFALAGLLAGFLTAGLFHPPEAEAVAIPTQSAPQAWTPPFKNGGWRLVSSRTTSAAWLYSTRTGRVYRVLKDCGSKAAPHGCLVPLPAIYGPHRTDELPSPDDDY